MEGPDQLDGLFELDQTIGFGLLVDERHHQPLIDLALGLGGLLRQGIALAGRGNRGRAGLAGGPATLASRLGPAFAFGFALAPGCFRKVARRPDFLNQSRLDLHLENIVLEGRFGDHLSHHPPPGRGVGVLHDAIEVAWPGRLQRPGIAEHAETAHGPHQQEDAEHGKRLFFPKDTVEVAVGQRLTMPLPEGNEAADEQQGGQQEEEWGRLNLENDRQAHPDDVGQGEKNEMAHVSRSRWSLPRSGSSLRW